MRSSNGDEIFRVKQQEERIVEERDKIIIIDCKGMIDNKRTIRKLKHTAF